MERVQENTLSHCLKGEGVSTQKEIVTSELYKLTRKKRASRTRAIEDATPGANDLVWRSPNADRNDKRKQAELCEAMGDWLLDVAEWDWFATLTFNRLVSANGAHYWFHRYVSWVAETSGVPIQAFRADEYGSRQGRLHIHALIGNVRLGPLFDRGSLLAFCGERLPPGRFGQKCCATHAWPCGYARVSPFDREKPASYYVSKYVVKSNGDWELIGF